MSSGLPLPMFPLGMVAFPGSIVPLHIFEDRYRQLARDLQTGEGRFGVVLITRGSEVGGGDERSSVGTRMRVGAAEEFDDGRWALVAIGEDRVRVTTWLPDDPYPLALVEPVTDYDEPEPEAVGAAERAVRRALERATRLGHDVVELDPQLSMDPSRRLWQLAAAAPLGPTDRQRILEAASAASRADLIGMLALDAAELFGLQLRGPDSD